MVASAYVDGEKELYGLLTQRCWDNLLTDSDCQKDALAKLMGYLLILGSLSVKAPQIAKILAAKSVAGLSPFSFYSELVIFIVNAVYHIIKGSPFSAYGEIITILVQVIVLVILLWVYMDPRPSSLSIAGLVAGFVATTVGCASLPLEYMVILPLSNLPLIIMAKAPQIVTNYRNGHTGQLASITIMLNFVGATIRIFTTIQEVGWDLGLLAMHSLSSALNGLLVLQVFNYWKETDEWSRNQEKKKTA